MSESRDASAVMGTLCAMCYMGADALASDMDDPDIRYIAKIVKRVSGFALVFILGTLVCKADHKEKTWTIWQ